jgi:holliday junction DNA helicase RuvA
MIAFIKGELTEKTPAYVIINCNGVGYMIHVSLNTYSQLPETSHLLQLHTYLVIREDAHTLFGFYKEEERELFKHLISVSGVGPNTARMILSSMSVGEIKHAILSNNISVLQSIKGIGAKSAQRIIVDIKDKIEKEGIVAEDNLGNKNNTIRDEALSALVMLGYNKATAQKTLNQVLKIRAGESLTIEQLIKESLKYS